MKRVLLILAAVFLATNASGQDISRHEADSMISGLKKTKTHAHRIELLLNLAQFHIFKPGENKIDFDSAMVYINEARALHTSQKSENAYGYLLLTESYLAKEKGQKDESRKMVEKSISILESGTNKDYLGRAYFELSMYYDFTDTIEILKKIELVQQSINAFERSGNLKAKGRSLQMLGDLYIWRYEDDKAISALQQSIAAYDSINYPHTQGVYVLLGGLYRDHRDYVPALSNLLRALKIAQLTKDSSIQLCQINNQLGLLYKAIDQSGTAIKYFKNGLTIAQKHKDENATFHLAMNLSSVYNNLMQPDESLKVLAIIPKGFLVSGTRAQKASLNAAYLRTYLGLGLTDSARQYYKFVLNQADKSTNPDNRSGWYRYVANYYLLTKEYSKARYYLDKSTAIADSVNYDYGLIQNLALLYKLDSVQGNFQAAFDHLLQYKAKSDSLSNERQLQVMNIEYEVDLKEDSIKLKDKDISFLKQENHLQQANVRQASRIRNITAGGIILAFIIIGLLYRLYRNKQKSNRLLQSQKEEINKTNQELQQSNEQQTKLLVEKDWLVKEIHHRVKNNLQMVMSLLNAQTEFLTHPSAIDAIKESRERMQAIAIIHQKLYQFDNSTQINMRSYINELIDNIKDSFADSRRIQFEVDVTDVNLDISQSVPLGLILNEAITNAIKYAYLENEKGSIQISLKHYDNDMLQLKVADNGKGLPADVDIKHSKSLGLQLIKLFSEQLEGDLYFINSNGLEITLNFNASGYHEAATDKIIA